MRLKVATYNIRKCVGLDWKRKPERVLAVIDHLDVDILVLQEADRRFGRRLTTLSHSSLGDAGWRAVPVAQHDGGIGWHGNAILVREGIEIEDSHRFDLPALEPRGAIVADLNVDGHSLRAVGTHLGLTHGMRVRQAHHIIVELDRFEPRPTVILGDMNTWKPQGGCISIFSERFHFAPPSATYHASRPVAALDRIGVTEGIAVRDQGVIREGFAARASDHLPLWAELELTSAPA